MLLYALSEYYYPGLSTKNHKAAVIQTAVAVLLAWVVSALLVTVFHDSMPTLEINGDYRQIISTGVAPAIEILLAAALAILWRASRFRNVLHVWLGIVLVALLCDNALTMMAGNRLTVGWYLGRLSGLVAASVLMLVYLQEILISYQRSVEVADRLAVSNAQLDHDIDLRERHAATLREAVQRRDEFLAMLAHELRNPLAPISAAAQLLSIGSPDVERIKKTSLIISRQIKHMTGLVDDLLDASRITRGLVALDKVPLNAKQILTDAIEQASPLIELKGHHLAIHLPPESAFILGDQMRMVQVMTNLINNAAKYTQRGGNISLRMDAGDTEIVLNVADNGIGMSPELTSRSFELFIQGERSLDRTQGGLGIGLALVRSLVELHGGHVSATSRGPALGSEFIVTLPRIAAPENTVHSLIGATARPSIKPMRVMVVDDNVDAADTLAALLKAAGHQVSVEYLSTLVVERARVELPDVCLIDIGMPGLDGNELARRLSRQRETKNCKLIALSGYGQPEVKDEAIEAGFGHYLVKPLNTAKLATILAG